MSYRKIFESTSKRSFSKLSPNTKIALKKAKNKIRRNDGKTLLKNEIENC